MAANHPALGVRHPTVVPTNFDPASDDTTDPADAATDDEDDAVPGDGRP